MSLSDEPSRVLLKLLNFLADFDGEIDREAAALLNRLRYCSEPIPPLYSDLFGLAERATCAEWVDRIEALSSEQRAICSYTFQIFRSYEQMLRVRTATSPEQQAAYEAQLEQVRLKVAKTKSVWAEVMRNAP
ncbi:MAG: hypothetical protein MUF72_21145 [Elainella sp. Prado103]|jgi:hypothetical protein|nr:hypothetical protein [Elainella sp. Prado103]